MDGRGRGGVTWGTVGQLRSLRGAQVERDLATQLTRGATDNRTRLGTVTSVSGSPPVYQVLVSGTTIGSIKAVSGLGLYVGDTVIIARNGADWRIVGVTNNALRSWTPVWVASTTAPSLGTTAAGAVQTGAWRMIGPTTMWVQWELRIGTDGSGGSGVYSVNGLPLTTAPINQAIAVFIGAGASGNTRYAGVGDISPGATSVSRIGANGQNLGVGSTAPAAFGPGCFLIGTGTIEVVF